VAGLCATSVTPVAAVTRWRVKRPRASVENAQAMSVAPPAPSREFSAFSALLLGADRKQRVRVEHSLTAALVYLICVGLMTYACWAGFMRARPVAVLSGIIVCNVLVFYALLRSGWSLRCEEPALALPQILSALTCIVGAYSITGPVHGSTMMLLTLVLMFGTFTLDARGARIASLYTVALMGVAISIKIVTEPEHYPIKLEVVNFMLTVTIMPTVSKLAAQLGVMRNRLKGQRDELSDALQRIQELATRDDLTKLYNRRHMHEIIRQHQKRLERSDHHRFCLGIIDLDHFKRVNDTHGHAGGDEVLCRFSQVALDVLRQTDVLARWGGEEFLVLLIDATPEQALRGMERLHERLAGTAVLTAHPEWRVTFSAGLASFHAGETLEACLERADQALYRAKQAGRDRTELCESDRGETRAEPRQAEVSCSG
jgi:diguanylate cyclase (GGDEF)-like protein